MQCSVGREPGEEKEREKKRPGAGGMGWQRVGRSEWREEEERRATVVSVGPGEEEEGKMCSMEKGERHGTTG